MITKSEQKIYNRYLECLQQHRGKPWRPRKDFSNFEENRDYVYVRRLSALFKKYPFMFRKEFFDAPYEILTNLKKEFYLKFYASNRGFQTATQYLNILQQKSPSEVKDCLDKSAKNIYRFCKENNLKTLRDYANHDNGYYKSFMLHIKDHEVFRHFIIAIPEMYNIIYALPQEDIELLFGAMSLDSLRNIYNSDKEGREYTEKLVIKLQEELAK
jgi:hypothetical protein